MFDYQSSIQIADVALTVKNLSAQTMFYQNVLGLEIIKSSFQKVSLGVGERILLTLIQGNQTEKLPVAGLYHIAFLLPTRLDLGQILYHILESKIDLIGASDHGYSEAIYLEDLEGNGIEIYADKPIEIWERDSAGLPVGKNDMLDVEGLLYKVRTQTRYRLPLGSKIGHVHLSVRNSSKTSELYQTLFPMTDKLTVPTVSFIAGGDYHHHIAVNQWVKEIDRRKRGQLGLAYITMEVSDQDTYDKILQSAQEKEVLVYQGSASLSLEDKINGFVFWIFFK